MTRSLDFHQPKSDFAVTWLHLRKSKWAQGHDGGHVQQDYAVWKKKKQAEISPVSVHWSAHGDLIAQELNL